MEHVASAITTLSRQPVKLAKQPAKLAKANRKRLKKKRKKREAKLAEIHASQRSLRCDDSVSFGASVDCYALQSTRFFPTVDDIFVISQNMDPLEDDDDDDDNPVAEDEIVDWAVALPPPQSTALQGTASGKNTIVLVLGMLRVRSEQSHISPSVSP